MDRSHMGQIERGHECELLERGSCRRGDELKPSELLAQGGYEPPTEAGRAFRLPT
jgi:hypothetical protein